MNFETVRFGDLFAEPQKNGLTRPKKVRGSGFPMVNMGELFSYPRIKDIPMDLVPVGEKESHYFLEEGDLLFARQSLVLSGAGQCSIFLGNKAPTVFESHLIRCRLNKRICNPQFYFYFFSSPKGRQVIETIVEQGAGASGIRGSDLINIPVPNPPKSFQDAVVSVLSALDDRATLLRETNETLEAIAQTLFKSWFVDFEPVHANAGTQAPSLPTEIHTLFPATFTDSPQGPIPEGWSKGTLSDVAETSRKQLKPEQLSSETLYVGLEHIPRKQLALDSWSTAEQLTSAKSAFERSDILFGKLRPYFHKVVVAPIDGVCSTDILVCKAKQTNYHYFVALHLFSDELISYADRLSNGAKMPRINWKDLAAYEVVIPPNEIAEEFQSLLEPMINRILANVEQAKTLSLLRDTLLPRLISGQLLLPDAEQAVEELVD